MVGTSRRETESVLLFGGFDRFTVFVDLYFHGYFDRPSVGGGFRFPRAHDPVLVSECVFRRGGGTFDAADDGSDDIAADCTHRGAHGVSNRRSGLVRIGDAGFTRCGVAAGHQCERCDENKHRGSKSVFHGKRSWAETGRKRLFRNLRIALKAR